MGTNPIALPFQASDAGSAVAGRIQEWVRRYSAKELCRRFPVSPKTAESWRAGNPPIFRHLVLMVDEWGTTFIEHVFAPVLDESDLSVARRIERIEQDLAALKGEFHEGSQSAAGAAADARSGVVHRARQGALASIAALLIGVTALQQVAPVSAPDMARLRHSPGRVVRVGGREGEA